MILSVAIPVPAGLAGPPGLHIPDGFMSTPISVVGWVITVAVLAVAVRQADRQLSERAVPLMGVMAAFIFAAQMMNFPIAGGTSGHLLGGALAAILLGPWAGIIVMAAVVGLQAVLFQDGGIVVMGVNILNMGILTVLVGTAVHRLAAPFAKGPVLLAVAFAAAWLSVEVAAIATALQLAASGTSPMDVVFPAMVGVHALIGVGEGLITAAALAFILATRPDLVPQSAAAAS